MKFDPRPLIPVIAAGLFAAGTSWFVEMPDYPVSAVHSRLVFLLAIFGWLYVSFGVLRQSGATYASGVLYGYLALLCGLYPDMWLRWPQASLTGAALAVWGGVLMWGLAPSRNFRAELAALACAVALAPVAVLPYWNWTLGLDPWIAAAAITILCIAAAVLWKIRQRITLPGVITWLFFIATLGALAVATQTRWLDGSANRMQFEEGLMFALLAVGAFFMADLLNVEKQLRRGPHLQLDASLKDPLTALANRRALELHGPQMIRQSHDANRAVSMIVADIDHFKQVNDTHGHLAGDEVLRRVSKILAGQVRKSDLVARYGGEEFIIILPGSPLAPALRLAERMRSSVEGETVIHDGKELHVTSSFGVVTSFPEEPLSMTQMIEWADSNLYRAKGSGRNRVTTDEVRVE